jgi:hypothetical protein
MELIDSDDWLKIVEKKLQILQCNNRDKIMMALQQHVGPTSVMPGEEERRDGEGLVRCGILRGSSGWLL